MYLFIVKCVKVYNKEMSRKILNPLSASVALIKNVLIDLHNKSIDWFLYEGNTGIKWVTIRQ